MVKVDGKYYLFYTGHTDGPMEFKEKIMVAEGDSPFAFTKRSDWELIPPQELGQKRDFRDPQAYYDPESGNITLTVTAAQDGVAALAVRLYGASGKPIQLFTKENSVQFMSLEQYTRP